jgi:hypothetical protein
VVGGNILERQAHDPRQHLQNSQLRSNIEIRFTVEMAAPPFRKNKFNTTKIDQKSSILYWEDMEVLLNQIAPALRQQDSSIDCLLSKARCLKHENTLNMIRP